MEKKGFLVLINQDRQVSKEGTTGSIWLERARDFLNDSFGLIPLARIPNAFAGGRFCKYQLLVGDSNLLDDTLKFNSVATLAGETRVHGNALVIRQGYVDDFEIELRLLTQADVGVINTFLFSLGGV